MARKCRTLAACL